MAADVVLESDSPNPCCAELKKRYLKLEEKRNALRQAVKLLERQIDKLDHENKHLKKVYEEQKLQGEQEKEAKEKESSIRNKLEKEVHDLKAEVSSYQKSGCLKSINEDETLLLKARILDEEEEIKRLKELFEKEQKKAGSEKKKAESEKKKAAEAWMQVKMEKSKAEEERRLAEIERKKAEECRVCWEKVKFEASELRQKLNTEISKAVNSTKMVEAEKQKTNREKKCADLERIKTEHKRLMEVERKKVIDEKLHADHLSRKLEEEKRRREELQKKIEEIVSAPKGRGASCFGDGRYNGGRSIEISDIKLLREQLKLEKKQVKHAKRIAKLAKAEKSLIMQELHLLKHDFMQILCRFNMLDGHLSQSIEGIDGVAKMGKSSKIEGFKLHSNHLGSMEGNHNSQIGSGLTETCCTGTFNYTEPTRECIGLLSCRESCTRPTTGIISELESPIGGSVRNKSQSSAVYSTTTSFSDRKLMGSQEQDSVAVTTSAKLAQKNSNQRSTVQKLMNKVGKTRKNKNSGVVAKNIDKSSGQREVENACLSASMHDAVKVVDQVSDRSSKKRKIQVTMESVAWLYSEYYQLHLKIGEKFSELRDLFEIEDSRLAVIYSQNCGISKDFDNGTGLLNEEHDNLQRRNYNVGRNEMETEQQTPGLQASGQNHNQMQIDKFETESSRDPFFLTETAASSHQIRENACIKQAINALSNKQDDLICFENMICGDYMKLLDLDNDADEARYRIAMEMPLSPTLPDIELPSFQLYREDISQYLTERENSMPIHSFDVMDLEISSNSSNFKASKISCDFLLRKNQDILYPIKQSRSSCLIPPESDVNQHNVLHNVGHNSNDHMNNIDMVPSMMDTEEPHCQAKPLVNCLPDTNAFANVCGDAVSGETDKQLSSSNTMDLFSKSTLHSHLLNEDECYQSCILEIHNLARNTSVANRQFGYSRPMNSGVIENPIEEGNAPDGPVFSESSSQMLDPEMCRSMNRDKNLLSAGKAKQTGIHLPLESVRKTEAAKQTPLSTSRNIDDASSGIDEAELGRTAKYPVVFSNNKDEGSMSRILCAMNSYTSQNLVSQTDHMVVEVLNALAMETALLPEEKVSIFFSLLLCNISGMMSANFKCTKIGHVLPCSESFAVQINRVISDFRTKQLLEEICQLDIFVSLVEDFLIGREVLMYTDRLHEPLCCHDLSSKSFHLDGVNMIGFSRAATVDQFVAGCIILASICAAADRIGFLLEASYSILRMCRNDISWILLAMHVFASVCGKKLFNLKNYSFLITALRSVVSFLERGHESISSSDVGCNFTPCEQCPFAPGAVCMDKFLNLLLDVLEDYNLNGIRHPHANEAIAFSVDTISACAERNEESTERNEENTESKCELDGLRIDCDASCCIFKYRKLAADHSCCFSERAFCHFTDIVSFVELVGCYMSWEWTYNNIAPRLLKMLESCVSEEFSAALSVLIGQLGRFGIDAGGYQLKGIAELRCNLSVFLDTNISRERSLPTQFAAVGALLNLLPLNFRDIIDEYQELTLDTSQSDHVKHIKKWFKQLSRDHQSLSLNLFGQAEFQKK